MGTVRQRKWFLGILLLSAAAGVAAAQSGKTPPPDKVPEDFPKDCPIIQNATVRDYLPAVKNRVKVGNILVLETQAPEAAITDFYKQALPTNGWTLLKHPKSEFDKLEATKGGRRLILGFVATHQGANPTTIFRLTAVGKQ